jgi:hypothetical protein
MFPTAKTPISSRIRRGLDLAVQFATLGEYAVEQPVRDRRPAPLERRPRAVSAVQSSRAGGATASLRAPREVRPASAAGRRRNEPAKRVPTRAAVRSLALRPAAGAPARPRTRVGQPPPRPQPCLAQ